MFPPIENLGTSALLFEAAAAMAAGDVSSVASEPHVLVVRGSRWVDTVVGGFVKTGAKDLVHHSGAAGAVCVVDPVADRAKGTSGAIESRSFWRDCNRQSVSVFDAFVVAFSALFFGGFVFWRFAFALVFDVASFDRSSGVGVLASKAAMYLGSDPGRM